MSIGAGILISYDIFDLSNLQIYDSSTFTGGSTRSQINANSFLFATLNSVNSTVSGISTLEPFRQYKLSNGTIVINGITYNAGDIMLFAQQQTLTTGIYAETTGYYSAGYVAPFLLISPFCVTYTPTQTGDLATDQTFEDLVRYVKYQIFTSQTPQNTTVSISTATTFIVKGIQNNEIAIGGQRYFVGEQFVKSSNFSFVDVIGTNYVVALNTEVENWYLTYKNAYGIYQNYIVNFSNENNNGEGAGNLLRVHSVLNAATIASDQGLNVDLTAVQNNIDELNNYWGVKANLNC